MIYWYNINQINNNTMITGYGISSYILIAVLIVGYFIVKKWGDNKAQNGQPEENYNQMEA